MRYIERIANKRKDVLKSRKWKRGQVGKLALALTLILGITQFQPVLASTIDEAEDKKNEAQENLNALQDEMNDIEQQQSSLQTEIDALDQDLVQVIMNLSILESDLETAQARLTEVQADLAQAQEDEASQYAAMKKRIQFMYERGDTAVLSILLESGSITDFLNRVVYVNEMYEYDRNLLAEYEATKEQVAQLETEVQGEIAEMEELQANLEEEQGRYETMIAQKQNQIADFDVKLASAQSLAAQYQDTIEQQNEIIRAEEERIRQEEEERLRREEEERRQQEAQNNNNSGNNSNNTGTGGNSDSGGTGGGGNKNPDYVTGVSGSEVVAFAMQFIGNPYEYGGTDIENGIDCSAFTQYVMRNFGVYIPRTSYEQRNYGQEVSYANAQPGDLICYSGHVALYIGNGQIVHASNSAPYPAGGIKVSSATYRTILSVRRVL